MKNLHWWLALGCIPLYGFWIIPVNGSSVPALQQAVRVEMQKEAKLNTELSGLEAQQSALQQEGETQSIEIIPGVLEQEFLLLDLRRITQGNGFSTSGFSFSKGQNEATGAAQMNISFSATGRTENIVSLLAGIEQNKKFLGLESLSFSEDNNGLVTVALNLYALAQSHD